MHTIVLFERTAAAQKSFKDALEKHGYCVHTAAENADGIALCREMHPALVITDFDDDGGPEIVQQLHSEFAGIPIVVLSGSSGPDRRRMALRTGASFCLAKPVDREALIQIADVALHSVELSQACACEGQQN